LVVQGSFDFATFFASEVSCFAQDDRWWWTTPCSKRQTDIEV
jgi:hypothetical protein